jgi:hypothetical protein
MPCEYLAEAVPVHCQSPPELAGYEKAEMSPGESVNQFWSVAPNFCFFVLGEEVENQCKSIGLSKGREGPQDIVTVDSHKLLTNQQTNIEAQTNTLEHSDDLSQHSIPSCQLEEVKTHKRNLTLEEHGQLL